MKNTYTSAALAVAGLGSVVNAHLFMSSPIPIAGSAPKDPLSGDGSNFPCHGVALPGSGGQSMPVGSSQSLVFDLGQGANTAVHGGGSCQLSITYETDPAKIKLPSAWKVIYSIEEGCPTNSLANLGSYFAGPDGSYTGSKYCTDPTTNGFDCVNSFNFTIPQGVKNGQATLAWTWFNNVGNREMYMNCAAVDISGGASDDTAMAGLPDLFVANLGTSVSGSCDTTASVNVQFPNPGQYVTTKLPSTRYPVSTFSSFPLAIPSGCGSAVAYSAPSSAAASTTSAAAITSPSSKSSSSISPSSVSSPKSSSSSRASATLSASASRTTMVTAYSQTTTSKYVATASSSSPKTTTVVAKTTVKTSPSAASGTATKVSTQQASTNKATTTKTTTTKAAMSPAATTKATTTSPSAIKPSSTKASTAASATSTCPVGSVPCSTFNAFICVDAGHYGVCDYNGCAVSQEVAPGTKCSNGMIGWAKKRSVSHRHRARNAHRHSLM